MVPRVLVNVSEVDISTSILGFKTSLPLYLTSTALVGLANPGGEPAIVRAANKSGVIYMLPTLSTFPLEKILATKSKN